MSPLLRTDGDGDVLEKDPVTTTLHSTEVATFDIVPVK